VNPETALVTLLHLPVGAPDGILVGARLVQALVARHYAGIHIELRYGPARGRTVESTTRGSKRDRSCAPRPLRKDFWVRSPASDGSLKKNAQALVLASRRFHHAEGRT